VVEYYCDALKAAGYPEIRAAVCVGGEQNSNLIEVAQKKGIHCIVATPGRLNDHLNKKRYVGRKFEMFVTCGCMLYVCCWFCIVN